MILLFKQANTEKVVLPHGFSFLKPNLNYLKYRHVKIHFIFNLKSSNKKFVWWSVFCNVLKSWNVNISQHFWVRISIINTGSFPPSNHQNADDPKPKNSKTVLLFLPATLRMTILTKKSMNVNAKKQVKMGNSVSSSR